MAPPLLATRADLRLVTGDDTITDVAADLYLGAASKAIRRFCGWVIAPSQAETFTVDGSGARALLLPTLYLTDVTSLTVDGVAVDLEAEVPTFEWSQKGMLWTSGAWSGHYRAIVAEVVHGLEELPEDLRLLAATVAGRAYLDPAMTITAESAGGMSVSYGPTAGSIALLAHEEDALAEWVLGPRP